MSVEGAPTWDRRGLFREVDWYLALVGSSFGLTWALLWIWGTLIAYSFILPVYPYSPNTALAVSVVVAEAVSAFPAGYLLRRAESPRLAEYGMRRVLFSKDTVGLSRRLGESLGHARWLIGRKWRSGEAGLFFIRPILSDVSLPENEMPESFRSASRAVVADLVDKAADDSPPWSSIQGAVSKVAEAFREPISYSKFRDAFCESYLHASSPYRRRASGPIQSKVSRFFDQHPWAVAIITGVISAIVAVAGVVAAFFYGRPP